MHGEPLRQKFWVSVPRSQVRLRRCWPNHYPIVSLEWTARPRREWLKDKFINIQLSRVGQYTALSCLLPSISVWKSCGSFAHAFFEHTYSAKQLNTHLSTHKTEEALCVFPQDTPIMNVRTTLANPNAIVAAALTSNARAYNVRRKNWFNPFTKPTVKLPVITTIPQCTSSLCPNTAEMFHRHAECL